MIPYSNYAKYSGHARQFQPGKRALRRVLRNEDHSGRAGAPKHEAITLIGLHRIRPFIAATALLTAPAVSAAESPRDPQQYFFEETFGNFAEELETARSEGKQGLMLFFELDDCPFCQRMKETVLNQPRVQDWYRERFRCFSVDIEGETSITDFQGRTMLEKDFAAKVHRVRATPVIAFFDLDGRPIMRYTGAPRDAEEFLWLGEFVADGHYVHTKFTRFKRAKQAEAAASARQ